MRLLTHNMLTCNVKACVETATRTMDGSLNFPLKIEVGAGEESMKMEESEYVAERALRLLPKLDWAALRKTASELGIADLPEAPPAKPAEDEAFLRSVHTLIMDVRIMEGALVCPNCSRRYPIKAGIPNMLLREDEL